MTAKVRVPNLPALRLDRLESRLASVWDRRLGIVVAPAGSGKTTLVAGFAASLDSPVAWYRAESWDSRRRAFLRHLQMAVGSAIALHDGPPIDARPWETVEAAATAIEAWPGDRLLLVVDDLHALEGTDAESALERLVDYAPAQLAVVVASRTQPSFNLSRRRVEGSLLEIASDDLRFRAWEVERLFREVYGLSIPPQELAVLARRTEGWAAGLQFFHLAVQGKSADERRRLLEGGGANARLVREYLARNVLAELPEDLRTFLVETCVLGRLSGALCDALLGRLGTARVLDDLERRQIFTTRSDDGSYRYHEVLRMHLEAMLVETYGETAARDRYRRAGQLLMAQEEIGEALGAYARAGDWQVVEALLGSRGERLVDDGGPGSWLDVLPAALVRNDPWLVLATARRARDEGRWTAANEGYRAAELAFGSSEGASIARRERRAVAAWLDVGTRPTHPPDGFGLLRAAVSRDPLAVRGAAARLDEPWRALVGGLSALLAGRPSDARRELALVPEHPAASRTVSEAAALAAAVAGVIAGDPLAAVDLERAVLEVDRSGTPWLARLARAASLLGTDGRAEPGVAELDGLRRTAADAGDPWGEVLVGLIEGWIWLAGPAEPGGAGRLARLEEIAARAAGLGAVVLEAWARAILASAAARTGDPDAATLATGAERTARLAACRAPTALAASPVGRGADAALASALMPVRTAAGVEIRCFGEFRLAIDGAVVDARSIRPRARSVLHLLTIRAGEAIHREVLEAAFWPGEPGDGASARLHVAISSIRRLVQADGHGASRIQLVRDREAYRLVLPGTARVDVRTFEDAVTTARAATGSGDDAAVSVAAATAVSLYGGDLLAEEGPAEWILEPRERYRAHVVEMVELQATLALRRGDPAAAAAACAAGIAIERFHDPFWRLLIEARGRAGDRGAALRAETDYAAMLAQLGVPIVTASTEPVANEPVAKPHGPGRLPAGATRSPRR